MAYRTEQFSFTGGYDKDTGRHNSSLIYDPVTDTHTFGPSLPKMMHKHRVIRRTSTNDFIFSGGAAYDIVTGNTDYDVLWSYNFGTSTWNISHQRLGVGRFGHGVALINNEEDMIVAGGKEYTSIYILTDSVEKYNFATDMWANMNSLPSPSDFSFLVKNDGVFTAISSTPDTVFEYDDVADQWNQRTGVISAGVVYDASLVDTEELYTNCG